METNETDGFEDAPGAARERVAALQILQLKREAIVDLLTFRRPNGELLVDSAIAYRVGCLPSEVAKVRREVEQQKEAEDQG